MTSTSPAPAPLRFDTLTGRCVSMQPLDQWNCEQAANWQERLRRASNPEEFSNGLICPSDGGNLYDTGQAFTGPPHRLRVKCMNHECSFRGERLERVNRIQE